MDMLRECEGFGWKFDRASIRPDWATLVAAKNKAVLNINESYDTMFKETPGLEFVQGWGAIEDAHTVSVRESESLDSSVIRKLDT